MILHYLANLAMFGDVAGPAQTFTGSDLLEAIQLWWAAQTDLHDLF